MVPEQLRTTSGDPTPEPPGTTEDPAPPERMRLAEDDLRRILERATRLDAERVTGVTVEDLRQIAAETGISPEALALALREAAEGELPASPPAPKRAMEPRVEPATPFGKVLRRLPGWIRTTAIAWASTITGFFAALSATELQNGEVLLVSSFVVLVWGAIELSVFHRKRGSLITYERDLLALWLPFATVGSLLGGPGSAEEYFLVSALFWAVFAVLGGLIATVRKRHTEPDES